jgi:hypothetical protein
MAGFQNLQMQALGRRQESGMVVRTDAMKSDQYPV